MRPFIFHQRDKSSFGANHRWRAVNTNVLEILPAELIGYKKESTAALISAAVVVADKVCKTETLASSFYSFRIVQTPSSGIQEWCW